jgi:hypothetical protein
LGRHYKSIYGSFSSFSAACQSSLERQYFFHAFKLSLCPCFIGMHDFSAFVVSRSGFTEATSVRGWAAIELREPASSGSSNGEVVVAGGRRQQ